MTDSRTCPVCNATRPLAEFRPTAHGYGRTCRNCRNPNATLEERFWAKVQKAGRWDCWEWRAQRNEQGYGIIKVGRFPRGASRIAWTLSFGDPGTLCVLHHCDNPPCCNPRHLFLGTKGENSLDCRRKGRWKHNRFIHARRRLTDGQIEEARARRATGESYRSIGRALGVHHTTVMRLIDGTHWAGYVPAGN